MSLWYGLEFSCVSDVVGDGADIHIDFSGLAGSSFGLDDVFR